MLVHWLPALIHAPPLADWFAVDSLVLGRYVDIDMLTEVERGNRLPYPPSDALEYAVHGKWKRNEDDSNGVHGCWYIPLKELMMTFKDDEEEDKYKFVREKIEEYEENLKEARLEGFENLADVIEAGDDDDDDP